MTVETSRNILNIFGIVDIIHGALELFFGFLATAGGGLLASGKLTAASGVTGRLVFMAASVFLLLGVFSLVEGILSRRAAKDEGSVEPVFVTAVVSLVLAVGTLIGAAAWSGSPASSIVSIVINVLLVMAADTLRKDEVTA